MDNSIIVELIDYTFMYLYSMHIAQTSQVPAEIKPEERADIANELRAHVGQSRMSIPEEWSDVTTTHELDVEVKVRNSAISADETPVMFNVFKLGSFEINSTRTAENIGPE